MCQRNMYFLVSQVLPTLLLFQADQGLMWLKYYILHTLNFIDCFDRCFMLLFSLLDLQLKLVAVPCLIQ